MMCGQNLPQISSAASSKLKETHQIGFLRATKKEDIMESGGLNARDFT